tara:strand:- start:237 stop:572 length:336 start_codon:yes stop_codon:yes gene_type:complete
MDLDYKDIDDKKELEIISEAVRPDQIKTLQEMLLMVLAKPEIETHGKFDDNTKKYLKEYMLTTFELGDDKITNDEAVDSFISLLDGKIEERQSTIEGSIEDEVMDWIEMVD